MTQKGEFFEGETNERKVERGRACLVIRKREKIPIKSGDLERERGTIEQLWVQLMSIKVSK